MQGVRAPQPSGTNSPSSSSSTCTALGLCDRESHERCATARVARGDPAALTGPYRPARERPARARPWRRGSPGPIPNPEVKPAIAESTAGSARGRTGRRARPGRFRFRREARGPPIRPGSGALFLCAGGRPTWPQPSPTPPGETVLRMAERLRVMG